MLKKLYQLKFVYEFLCAFLSVGRCMSSGDRSLIDLSYAYDPKFTPSHPAVLKFDLRLVKTGYLESGKWYFENEIFTSEHVGTHIDAPIHVSEGQESVDEISLNKLYRVPGVMIDIRNRTKNNKNYLIRSEDIKNWIKANGDIPFGSVVLFQTGWGEKVSHSKEYRGIDAYGRMNFPGLSESAAKFVVTYKNNSELMKGIIGVGIDTLSIESGQESHDDSKLTVHRLLLENKLFVLENLANLDKLPINNFTLTMLPMKIKGGSGAPTRVVAEINGRAYNSPNGSTSSITQSQILQLVFNIWLLITFVY